MKLLHLCYKKSFVMKIIKTLFLTLLVLPVLGNASNHLPDSDPTSATSTKAVFVDAKTKQPLSGITVQVRNLADNTITKVKTDANGVAMIPHHAQGDYEIVVENAGYKKFETKSNASKTSLYFNLTKEESFHPFIRFK